MRDINDIATTCAWSRDMSLDEDARWLEWVTKQFESIAGDDKEIDLDEFKTALKVKEVSLLIMETFYYPPWDDRLICVHCREH